LKSSLNFLSFKIPLILKYECFLKVYNRFYLLKIFPSILFIIWVLLIVLCKIDSFWYNKYSFSNVLNWNLKFYKMDFWFELCNIHINEKWTICHDYHGFKWENINNFPILIFFFPSFNTLISSFDYDCTQNKIKKINILLLSQP
jgi:hypothetical protein